MWDAAYAKYLVFMMVFARMSGIFLMSPLLGRKNVPGIVKVGLALFVGIAITSAQPELTVNCTGLVDFFLALVKEFFVGYAISFVMELILSALTMAGEIIDLQLGFGMSRVYDPQSGVSMSLTSSVFNYMFVLIFFGTNGHLTLIQIASASFGVFPPGPVLPNAQCAQVIPLMFSNMLILALKIAVPIIAIELLVETGMGILMRTVPQINIFVVGLQLKLLVGLAVIVMLLPGITGILDSSVNVLFQMIKQAVSAMA